MIHDTQTARARAVALLIAACAVALPAHAGLFDDEEARRQATQAHKRIDELRTELEQAAGRMGKMEDALKNQPVLELATRMEALREELKSLRGQIEVVNNSIESAAKRQRDMYVDLDTRMRRMEQAASASPPAAAPASPQTSAPAATTPTTAQTAAPVSAAGTPGPAAPASASGDETRVYEAAQAQRRIGNYQGAIAAFQSFVTQYPKSPLAPRAQYWIGDSYFNLRDYKNAIASQQKLVTTYADSPSVPDALLNIASSQAEQGEAAAARKTLDGLVNRYPSSEAAEKAKRRLATLK